MLVAPCAAAAWPEAQILKAGKVGIVCDVCFRESVVVDVVLQGGFVQEKTGRLVKMYC